MKSDSTQYIVFGVVVVVVVQMLLGDSESSIGCDDSINAVSSTV